MECTIDYFYQNSPKEWNAIEAFMHYDKVEKFESFADLVARIHQDLLIVEKKQPLFRKYIATTLGLIKNVENMKCVESPRQQPQQQQIPKTSTSADTETEREQPHKIKDKENELQHTTLNFDNFTNNGEFNVIKNNTQQKRISLLHTSNTASSSSTVSPPPPLVLTEGSVTYKFEPPCSPVDQPHRPKLRKIQIGELEQLFHFGTEYCHMDDVCKEDYRVYQQEQSQNSSLCHLDLLNKLTHLLEKVHYDAFLDEVWSMKPNENMSDQGKVFLVISKHVLSSFHLAHRSTPVFMLNHERTSFCENIVPGLLALSKMTGFLEFRWCEAPFNATKSNYLKEGDYDGRSIQAAKNIDALGLLKTRSNMELVIVEASSGILKEHTTHTIEDSLKILECSVASLRREAANYKFSSLETFKKLNTYGIQIIKSKITLSKTSLYNKNTWKHVEMRTAKIPTTWHNRIILLEYLELLATLFVCIPIDLLHTQVTEDQLLKERVNVVKRQGDLVDSIIT